MTMQPLNDSIRRPTSKRGPGERSDTWEANAPQATLMRLLWYLHVFL